MDLELVTHLVTIALSVGVGGPILFKALRGRERLAALLAASLVIDGIEWALWAGYLYWPGSNPLVNDAFAVACRIGISGSLSCLACFTWLTFRPQSRGARGAFWSCVAVMATGFVGSGAVGDWRGFRSDHVWIWLENGAQIFAYAWACSESLLYYRNARKRAAHGFADPVVANRFGLWGIYAGSYGMVQILFVAALASPEGFTELGFIDIVLTFIGVGALWLAFYPPRRYKAWLRGPVLASA